MELTWSATHLRKVPLATVGRMDLMGRVWLRGNISKFLGHNYSHLSKKRWQPELGKKQMDHSNT